ncbi:hypothetical protein ACA910_005596 [Epithemia clementina (nom. ined.)]
MAKTATKPLAFISSASDQRRIANQGFFHGCLAPSLSLPMRFDQRPIVASSSSSFSSSTPHSSVRASSRNSTPLKPLQVAKEEARKNANEPSQTKKTTTSPNGPTRGPPQAKSNDQNNKNNNKNDKNGLSMGWIAADLTALLVAMELQGLLDVITAHDFVAKGGWLQPIFVPIAGGSDSTLPLLVQRESLLGSLWCLSLLAANVWTMTTSTTTITTTKVGDKNNKYKNNHVDTSSMVMFQKLGVTLGMFAILRLVLVAFVPESWSLLSGHNHPWDAVRDVYFVGLATLVVRVLVQGRRLPPLE